VELRHLTLRHTFSAERNKNWTLCNITYLRGHVSSTLYLGHGHEGLGKGCDTASVSKIKCNTHFTLIVHWTIRVERRLLPSPAEMACVRGQLCTKFHLIVINRNFSHFVDKVTTVVKKSRWLATIMRNSVLLRNAE
jgi:hypothetical protein